MISAGNLNKIHKFTLMVIWVLIFGTYASVFGAARAANGNGFIAGNLSILSGQGIRSNNGQYFLDMQTDGNLVLYRINSGTFATNTSGSGANHLVFQSDGNLVLYNGQGGAVWHTRTHGNPGSRLTLQDDGNLVIYRYDGYPLWKSNTSYPGAITSSISAINTNNLHPKVVIPQYGTYDTVISDYDLVEENPSKNLNVGLEDSTRFIQDALDKCRDNGGGTVWLPIGRYRVTSTINIWPFCTLRGDWQDPDRVPLGQLPSYGTIIQAEVPLQSSVFQIAGSASLNGVTIFYPDQSLSNVKPYEYTISIPGGGWDNYMLSSVINVTFINSYKGICISPNPNVVHECAQIKNVKGCFLSTGISSMNSADVDVFENITLNNKYWTQASYIVTPPLRTDIDQYTLINGTGMQLGAVEWVQVHSLDIANYHSGLVFTTAPRAKNCGGFVRVNINDCDNAILATGSGCIDARWGVSFVDSTIHGRIYSVNYNAVNSGWLKFNNCNLAGAASGYVIIENNVPPPPPQIINTNTYIQSKNSSPRPPRLFNVLSYGVYRIPRNGQGVIPADDIDATQSIQNALNDAGLAGGGVVYLPAGMYYLGGHLTVPANVELRGACGGPHRDLSGNSGGTVLFAQEGSGSSSAAQDVASITLNGDFAGVSGLRIFYPKNNLFNSNVTVHPYSIRGNGKHIYTYNISLPNSTYGIDFCSYNTEFHYIEGIVGSASTNMILLGNGSGLLKNLLVNPTALSRVGYGIHGWWAQENTGRYYDIMQNNLRMIHVAGAIPSPNPDGIGEVLSNVFGYAAQTGLINETPGTLVYNIGTDQLGPNGVSVIATQPVTVINIMRSYGAGSTYGYPPYGAITLYCDNIIAQ